MRIEIAERLYFKYLEKYGHALKAKHKAGFKRHIKLDDSNLCLYMDAFLPKVKEWMRIDVELAREDNARRTKKIASAKDKKLLSTVESEDEEK